jgi:hypothetical protein
MSVLPLSSSVIRAITVAAAIAFGGCNSLLDNRPADLVTAVSGTDPEDGGTTSPEARRDADASASSGDPSTDARAAPPPCVVGEKPCEGSCVSTNLARYGCGGPTCDRCEPAHATAACASSACAVGTCDTGWADCNGLAADGCETDLSSLASCGACGAACAPAGPNVEAACTSLTCTRTCQRGYGDCNGDPADGCEVDLLESRRNCGVCGRVCAIGGCDDGACRFQF